MWDIQGKWTKEHCKRIYFVQKKKIKKINETKSSQKFLMLDLKDVYPPPPRRVTNQSLRICEATCDNKIQRYGNNL